MSSLPDLPRVKKQREAESSITFRRWIEKNPQFSGSYEMKDTRGKPSLPFSEVKDAQINYGLQIKSPKGVLIRIQGLTGEPDYGYFRSAAAWIVIKYPNGFEVIDIETFAMEKKRTKEKSLTHSRAREISTYSFKSRDI